MQEFIANGRVANIPTDAVGKTANGHVSFKFDFACDSSLQGNDGKPLTSFFHVQVYGKQAEIMAQSLSKGSPILVKGEIIQRSYVNDQGQNRSYQYIAPSQHDGITFLESKDAAVRRKQGQFNPSQPATPPVSSYPEPMDADEPF
ncbi:TPA: single-stranded DNA-binding protein [Streptococcus suis]|uniref:single-stranded DNA-binding protein n=1 Tax=Streptococcus agalactiae TaxID=1311 RepID=UPI0006406C70|nr:single-stranded DNA-binding protein [Streptococcus agalactiae]KLL92882.1 single-stranded DNA-binding protein [Streptococcus agalactiae]